jgi:hypothetical protein
MAVSHRQMPRRAPGHDAVHPLGQQPALIIAITCAWRGMLPYRYLSATRLPLPRKGDCMPDSLASVDEAGLKEDRAIGLRSAR